MEIDFKWNNTKGAKEENIYLISSLVNIAVTSHTYKMLPSYKAYALAFIVWGKLKKKSFFLQHNKFQDMEISGLSSERCSVEFRTSKICVHNIFQFLVPFDFCSSDLISLLK